MYVYINTSFIDKNLKLYFRPAFLSSLSTVNTVIEKLKSFFLSMLSRKSHKCYFKRDLVLVFKAIFPYTEYISPKIT